MMPRPHRVALEPADTGLIGGSGADPGATSSPSRPKWPLSCLPRPSPVVFAESASAMDPDTHLFRRW